MANPRYANGSLRRKYRARFKAMGGECGICAGRLGPIHYDEPSDAAHPLSFVIDEKRPERLAHLCADAELPAKREADGSAHPGEAHTPFLFFCTRDRGGLHFYCLTERW